uniref:UPF0481 protein At3g47200 isoform X1 n=1 Tax=Elaeis guineensis var. tenera TaxID=51953 RepID=A0A6J0PFL3_ELAGV|nr:UPF0481 protein At3g47200 isoform X1 [Elaeis guineensis]
MSDSDSETAQVPSEPDSDSETPPENSKAAQWFREEEDFTIYGVPPEIFERDRKAYQPKAVCIGPFFREWRHRGHLEVMQQYKWECTKRLMPKKETREKCLTEMKELEASVRQKYSEKFPKIISDDFARMLMLDGCFLLHLLRRYAPGPEEPKSGHKEAKLLVGRMQIWELVRYDLLLLQNQIPFCVIQRLHEFLYPDDSNTNLVDCAINFFSSLRPCRKLKQSRFYIQVKDVHHLLHLIYSSLLPCPKYGTSSSGPKSSRRWIPSATELQLAGMNFKRRESANGFLSFLDVKFSDGVMEIPKIKVHDYSTTFFRNLIAWEQCFPRTECHVTAYAFFMNFLINTEKDMRLLHLKEILIDLTTVDKDKGATHFFSRLCNEVGNNKNYLGKLFSDVMDYHDTPLNKWRAELNEKYFKSPLTIISLTAGAIALPLSVASNIKNIFF